MWPFAPPTCLSLPSHTTEQLEGAQIPRCTSAPRPSSGEPSGDAGKAASRESRAGSPSPTALAPSTMTFLEPMPRSPPPRPCRWLRPCHCAPEGSSPPPSWTHLGGGLPCGRPGCAWNAASLCWPLRAMAAGGNPGRPLSGPLGIPGPTGRGGGALRGLPPSLPGPVLAVAGRAGTR